MMISNIPAIYIIAVSIDVIAVISSFICSHFLPERKYDRYA